MKLNAVQRGTIKAAGAALLTAGTCGQVIGYFLPGAFSGLAAGIVGLIAGVIVVWSTAKWYTP